MHQRFSIASDLHVSSRTSSNRDGLPQGEYSSIDHPGHTGPGAVRITITRYDPSGLGTTYSAATTGGQ